MVHRSGGLFLVADAAAESARAAALEISPTGPIFGAKMRQPGGAVRELEESVWREQGLPSWDDLELPRGLHVDGTRRALRVPIGAASQRALDDDAIELRFELPAGSYATVLIEELFPGEAIAEGAPLESSAVGSETTDTAGNMNAFIFLALLAQGQSASSRRVRAAAATVVEAELEAGAPSSSISTPTSTPCCSASRRRRRRRSASPPWSRCAPPGATRRPPRPSG